MTASGGEPQRFFFVHIMKTAGTALRQGLIDHFGAVAVYPTYGLDGDDKLTLYTSVDVLRRRLRDRGDQIRVITGHFPLRTLEVIEGRFTTMTVLRDPVERMLSFLRQRRDGSAAWGPAEANDSDRRPLDQVYDGLYGLADNNMTKMLSLTPVEMSDSVFAGLEVDRHHLERAKEALAGMDAVGLQERFEDFRDLLGARYGVHVGELGIINATAPLAVSESLRERIAEANQLDAELYEFATRMLDADGRRSSAAAGGYR